ncbi:type II toxin-antitoxin system RelE/ParE family toxin [bacterium]|nr:type II toxin-antitoxin system RelE/ParE family toxin [candidate division CSSED10-310 bacterium]
MIKGFRSKETEILFQRKQSHGIPADLHRIALRKLLLIDAAEGLQDLRVPPGNYLEKLRGNRDGQYSIRINDQWRICFRWSGGNAFDVEIVDYH